MADVDNTIKNRIFTQERRKQSETEKNKSAITDLVCQTNHFIN